MAESKAELESFLTKVKEERGKAGLKLNSKKKYGIWSHHFMTSTRGTMETVTDFIILGSKITLNGDCSHEI